MKKLAVLISNAGTGTNLQAIIDGVESGKIQGEVAVVISDKEDAYGLVRGKKHNIPIEINADKDNLLTLLKKYNIDYVALTGWKQFLTQDVLNAYKNRILNTHPGLIPDTLKGVVKNPDGSKGLWNKKMFAAKALQNFLDKKVTYAGCTNHFLSDEIDFGSINGRCFEKVRKEDTVESLYKRLKVKENKLYVGVLAKLCTSTILITDGGGRGAALVDKYAQSKHVGKILVVPGNDLMQLNTIKPVKTYSHLKTTNIPEILEIVKKERVDLVDVAQDNAVAVGLVDELQKIEIKVVGPTKKAGQIEWDKAWARDFMVKYKIPSPKFYIFKSIKEGIEFVKKNSNPMWFVKASGLAEGKGVLPAVSKTEAIFAINQMQKFGSSGKTFLLEEWLVGEEFSAFAICDGKDFQIVGFAQDHKRVNDGDQGSNTGGMGSVSNPLVMSSEFRVQSSEIIKKAINGLAKEGRPYKGVLYLGGMVVGDKVYVIEFNARWGDPEAQVILPGIKNDLYEIDQAIIAGTIGKLKIQTDGKVRIGVVGASKGYPDDYSQVRGKGISGLDKIKEVKIYGAGVKAVKGKYIANGGRLFCLVAEGKNILEARKKAYKEMSLLKIEGNNLHYRKDIGWRDLERL